MKFKLDYKKFFVTSALIMSAAGFAAADELGINAANLDGNKAEVVQENANETAHIFQVMGTEGGGNFVYMHQYQSSGDPNQIGELSAFVRQVGNENKAKVRQLGMGVASSGLNAGFSHAYNFNLPITFYDLEDFQNYQVEDYEVFLRQEGNGNVSRQLMQGHTQFAFGYQLGDDNKLRQENTDRGNRNAAVAKQDGSDNEIIQEQAGAYSYAEALQLEDGSGNFAKQVQEGGRHVGKNDVDEGEPFNYQLGNIAQIKQTGMENDARQYQNGEENYASIKQSGELNDASQNQIGTSQVAVTEQDSMDNDATINQGSVLGDTDSVWAYQKQIGEENSSLINQLGSGHEAVSMQFGNFNNADINQSGSNSYSLVVQNNGGVVDTTVPTGFGITPVNMPN